MYRTKYLKYKTKYLDLKNRQHGGASIKLNGKIFNGAGVLLVEHNKAIQDYNLWLFKTYRRDKQGNTFELWEDLGGSLEKVSSCIDGNLGIADGAIRELYEESRGLFNIVDPKVLYKPINNKNMWVDAGEFRSFIVGIKEGVLNSQIYETNKKNLDDNKNIPYTMKETYEVKPFSLKLLLNLGLADPKKKSIEAVSLQTGIKYKFSERATRIMRDAYNAGLIKLAGDNPKNISKINTTILTD